MPPPRTAMGYPPSSCSQPSGSGNTAMAASSMASAPLSLLVQTIQDNAQLWARAGATAINNMLPEWYSGWAPYDPIRSTMPLCVRAVRCTYLRTFSNFFCQWKDVHARAYSGNNEENEYFMWFRSVQRKDNKGMTIHPAAFKITYVLAWLKHWTGWLPEILTSWYGSIAFIE